ncbi:MAG: hypothetical protein N4A33_12205 [Bacteriovoracaceae bacterium]|jgi:hypothetical protein|nr:hypothetical protein [Bacteriovoracaceae bacterium]
MKKLLLGLLVLGSISTFADTVTCTIKGGKNIQYLPTTVILNTEAILDRDGNKDFLEFKGLTHDGSYYTGGKAFFGDLGFQVVYGVKEYTDSEIILKESDERRSDIYKFNLVENKLEVKVKTSKFPLTPKVFTMSKASYSCITN